jgi:YegS/Rv2252/BmrU family lipid kinase
MSVSEMKKKRIVIILNGISLQKKLFYHKIAPALSKVLSLEIVETRSRNDAVTLASKATDQLADLVLAAGGDGTLNQVLNGVLRGREKESRLPVIGLIPIGSGNDFARTAGITHDPEKLIQLMRNFTPKKTDIGKVTFMPFPEKENQQTERYFVNVADIGMGPVVVDHVLKSGRPFGHGAAYYKSILSTFFTYKPMMVTAQTADWSWTGKLRTLAIGNGKFYGHGLCVAPDAVIDDRMFTAFICGNVSVFDFVRHTPTLMMGKFITNMEEVHYKKTTSISLSSESTCLIEGDGEILGTLPGKIELIDRQLDLLI